MATVDYEIFGVLAGAYPRGHKGAELSSLGSRVNPVWFQAWFSFALGYVIWAEYQITIPADQDDRFRTRLRAWERAQCARMQADRD